MSATPTTTTRPAPPFPIVLYDGECGLCDASVRFLLRWDWREELRFASLQSPCGQELLRQHGLPAGYLDSVVLVEQGKAWRSSEAAWRLALRFPLPWRWLSLLRWVPLPLREWGYAWVAARRTWWPRPAQSCMMATPRLRARFIEQWPPPKAPPESGEAQALPSGL